MPKIKAPRKGISLDMTAMCDMAFLLLTFFILTAKMKSPEPARFDVPSSIDTSKVQDKEMVRISVSNDGRIFVAIKDPKLRESVVKLVVNEFYKVGLSEDEIHQLALIENFGLPVSGLKAYLQTPEEDRAAIAPPGIPCDTKGNNELEQWIDITHRADSKLKIGVKADKDCPYKVFKEVLATMQVVHLNHISLITTLEERPE